VDNLLPAKGGIIRATLVTATDAELHPGMFDPLEVNANHDSQMTSTNPVSCATRNIRLLCNAATAGELLRRFHC